jgi:hypothetical protein
MGLMGDPALRLHIVQPPRNLRSSSASSQVTLGWDASTETAFTYSTTQSTAFTSGHSMSALRNDYLSLTYTRPEPVPGGITYTVEASPDLAGWTTTGLVQVSSTVNGSLRTTTVRDAAPLDGSSKRFLRLRVTQP